MNEALDLVVSNGRNGQMGIENTITAIAFTPSAKR